jgi:hypothetical protein
VGEAFDEDILGQRSWHTDQVRWRWSGLVLLGVVCLGTGCSSSPRADGPTHEVGIGMGTISGIVVLERTPPIPIPNASLTMRSQAGATRTVKASSKGAFTLRVPTGTWAVMDVVPLVGSSYCAIPNMINVTRSQTSTVRIRMACASLSGGGSFVGHPSG